MNISFENALYMDVGFSEDDNFDVGFVGGDAQEDVEFNPNAISFDVSFSDSQQFDIDFGGQAQINPYSGSYEITPSSSEQVLLTKEKYLSKDVVINPIPSNYGLVTWDGTTLTVS